MLQVAADANLGAVAGPLILDGGALRTTANMTTARATQLTTNGGTLETATGTTLTNDSVITGTGQLTKAGDGILLLNGVNSYTGGTLVTGGIIQIASDASLGDPAGTFTLDGGTLRIVQNVTATRDTVLGAAGGTVQVLDGIDVDYAGSITGGGSYTKTGGGNLFLTGTSSFTGPINLLEGSIFVDGDLSAVTGATTVAGGARLSGNGVLGGAVTVNSGGRITAGARPGDPATLTVGPLTLLSGSNIFLNIVDTTVGGALNDLIEVNGDLVLDGRVDVLEQQQTLGPGVYRIINYSGALTDNVLDIGSISDINGTPTRPLDGFSVQTVIPGQVNLINTQGLALSYWDGTAGPKNNNAIDGGVGIWRHAGPAETSNWTDPTGAVNAPWADNQFAIFLGTPATITVSLDSGPVATSGMQFGVDGYVLEGDTITLVDSAAAPAASIIRVGDGTRNGVGITATIDAPLTGSTLLRKTDTGTLVLGGTNSYAGGTSIEGGVLQIASDANLGAAGTGIAFDSGTLRTTASITTDRAAVLGAGGGTFDTTSGTLTLSSAVSGTGPLRHSGAGTLTLLADATYTGGTTNLAGTLQLGNGGTTGAILGPVINLGAIVANRSNTLTLDSQIIGGGTFEQAGTGTTIFTADHLYTGLTTISAGTLQLGAGGATGSVVGDIVDNANLVFDRNNLMTLTGTISGNGTVVQQGGGDTILTGNNSYTGPTSILAGALFVDGDQSAATGSTSVAGLARLSGNGIVGGDVVVANDGRLAPASVPLTPATLTINGNLTLNSTSVLVYDIIDTTVGGAFNDLTVVGGDLTLDGRIDVLDQGQDLGPGVYRVINYGGVLTNNGLDIGTFVSGEEAPTRPLPAFVVQTVIPGQVNLVNTSGVSLNYWDGSAATDKNDSTIQGGIGTWVAGASSSSDWTDVQGAINGAWADSQFAIFLGDGDTVTSSNTLGAVRASGMQFGVDGYVLQGDTIELVGTASAPGDSVIRVGDGTEASAAMSATIASALSGTGLLRKTDGGTLVLSGANTYNGGTVIEGGVLEVAADTALGGAGGRITLEGGTLRVAADMTSARNMTMGVFGGSIETATAAGAATVFQMDGAIGGVGALTKAGAGTLIFTANDAYRGGTTIAAGTLQLGNGGTTGGLLGPIIDNGVLVVNRSNAFTLFGVISGAGSLQQAGTGTTILTADNTYTGGTTISAGTLQIGNGGTTGHVVGDILNNATLVIDRSNLKLTPGLISGVGQLIQAGTGTTVLQADNTYTGGTTINAGTLQLGDGGTTGSLVGDVVNNSVFAFNRSDVVTYPGVISGPGSLQILGPGTIVLTGANTMTGGTTVADGTLQIGDGGVVGRLPGDIVNNGRVVLDHADDLVFANVVSGTGSFTKEGGGTLFVTGANTFTGGTVINEGRIEVGNGGTTGSFVGNVVDNAELAVNRSDSFLVTGVISGTGLFEQLGTGTTVFEADNTYSGGTTIAAGTLQIGNGGVTGSVVGDILDNGKLVFNRADTLTMPNVVSGTGELVQAGLGTLIIASANTHSGGTAIESGVMQIASDTALGDTAGGLRIGGGTLRTTADMSTARATVLAQEGGTFDTVSGTTLTHTGLIDGAGGLTKTGDGRLIVSAPNAYAGPTDVAGGSLWVQGDQSAALGTTTVLPASELGGVGILGGDVAVAAGGTLAPGNSPGTLTVNGDLALDPAALLAYEFGQPDVEGGAFNDLTVVNGNLLLDGTINVSVSAGGAFGPGIYRIFNYAGALADNGLEIGAVPVGGYYIQVSVPNQVNLINTTGLLLNYWDGANGTRNDGLVAGGDGTWLAAPGNDNWTTETGSPNAPYSDAAFAVFQGAPGAVTVDRSAGAVTVSGMQFAVGGYVLSGEAIDLVGAPDTIVRVGDGSANSAAMTATINASLAGQSRLFKTDAGTLVLGGANTYSGGTMIDNGVLQIGSDANLGAANSVLGLAGGTLRTTADISTARPIELGGGDGTFETLPSTTLTLNGVASGSGELIKSGAGTLVLTGANTYAGTQIDAGTVQVSLDANLGNGALSLDGGTLRTTADIMTTRAVTLEAGGGTFETLPDTALTLQGAVAGPGAMTKTGAGDLVLTAANTYSGATNVNAGLLAIGDSTTPDASITSVVTVAAGAMLGGYGSVTGDVTNAGTIAVADAVPRFSGDGSGQFTIRSVLTNAGLVDLAGAAPGNRLSVSNYAGQGGIVSLLTTLAGDNSPTDQLVIEGGTATGNSRMRITSATAGDGAETPGNGIEVVAAENGATTAPDAFALEDRVVAGPYEYDLVRGGRDGSEPESWFLRTERTDTVDPTDPLLRPEVPTYTVTPALALLFGQDLVGTLHERVGEQEQLMGRIDDGGVPSGTWGRLMGRHFDREVSSTGADADGPEFRADHYAIQVGFNLLRRAPADDRLVVAGVYGAFGGGDSRIDDLDGSRAGQVRFEAYSVGGYGTWFGPSGAYVDGVVQFTRYENRAGSGFFADMQTETDGVAVSLEAGRSFALRGGLSLQPQGQLVYQTVDSFGGSDPAADVRFEDIDSLAGRLGLRLVHDSADRARPLTWWLRANVWHEFSANPKTSFSSEDGPVPFHLKLEDTWGELGAGVSAEISPGANLYANGGYASAFGDGISSWNLRVGLRVDW